MDEFAREWTYRSPLKTITYPKGHKEALPADVRKAAKAAEVLVEPPVEAVVDTTAPQKPKRPKKPE